MQEDTTQKTVSLVIKGGKINADILKSSLKYLLNEMQKEKAHHAAKKNAPKHGKQSMQDLQKSAGDGKLTNIQIDGKNIGSFDRYARKYDINYTLKKDKSAEPPVYYVFFRAKDVDAMTAAFREYTNDMTKKKDRPSVCQKLAKALEAVRNNLTTQKEKHKRKEHTR